MRAILFLFCVLYVGCDADPGPSYQRDAFSPTSDMNLIEDASLPMMPDQGQADPDAAVVDSGRPLDAVVVDEGTSVARPALDEIDWAVRVCTQLIRHCARPGTLVRIAGEFTCNEAGRCWADGARPLTATENPCSADGAVWHELLLDRAQPDTANTKRLKIA